MARWTITMVAMICMGTCTAQGLRTNADLWLKRHHTEASIATMVGISYFEYSTKAIEPHFVTPELSLEFLFSTRVAEHWKVQYGVVASYKGTSTQVYDHTSSFVPYEAMTYRLMEVDAAVSQYSHGFWGLPIKVQYHPARFGLTLGAMMRHFVVNGYYTGYPTDPLSGTYDAGVVAGIGLPFGRSGNFRLGFEYYFGFVNIHPLESWEAAAGYYVDYRTVNRSGQFLLRYILGNPLQPE